MRLNKYKFSLTITAVIVFLIGFHYLNLLRPVESIVAVSLEPFQKFSRWSGIKIKNLFEPLTSRKKLVEENKKLHDQLNNLIVENVKLKKSAEAQEILAKELAYLKETGQPAVVAQIIARGSETNLAELIINKGSAQGLKEGNPVVAAQGILIGKLTKVQSKTSQVLLLTDSHSTVGAEIVNQTKTSGLVQGEHNLSMKMTLIPQNEEIARDQDVITSGLEKSIPAGLVIGQIDEIITKAGELFKSATIKSPLSFNRLEIVTVLTSQND